MANIKRKGETELAQDALVKVVRMHVRAYYAIQADAALNEILPDIVDEHNRAVAAGEEYEFNYGNLERIMGALEE